MVWHMNSDALPSPNISGYLMFLSSESLWYDSIINSLSAFAILAAF